ncbi:unnamed protein product [[Candida] boidinii]|nr:unnamed protein product [[Candida] boidinii]
MVLQRSGIGEPSKLRAAGVKPIVELPGVDAQKSAFDQWYATGTGPLATNGIEAGVKIRPTKAELATADKDFQEGWESYFENKPDKPLMHYSVISGFFGDHTKLPPGKYMTMFHFLEYPFSRV